MPTCHRIYANESNELLICNEHIFSRSVLEKYNFHREDCMSVWNSPRFSHGICNVTLRRSWFLVTHRILELII